ncbi:MAG: HAMP domain-containing sensor histidine kinase [Acidobacteriota bacterium]
MAESGGADPLEFYARWAELTHVSERIYQRGFDAGHVLFEGHHEIRSLACAPLAGSKVRHLVVAGDKLGCWYAAELNLEQPESRRWCELPKLPSDDATDRVIEDLLIVERASGTSIVLATRGNGAWIVGLDQVARRLTADELVELSPVQLAGSEGRAVDRLTYDTASGTLLAPALAGASHELLQWSLRESEPSLAWREELPYRITALAIDSSDRDVDPAEAGDALFVATGSMELHRFEREQPAAPFRVTAEDLAARRREGRQVWCGRLSPIHRMRPLSEVGGRDPETGVWRRTYPHRGVLATTLRHLLVIHDTPEAPGQACSHARLVAGRTENLSLCVLNLPESGEAPEPATGWHGVAVSTLEGRMRMFRPSSVRRPEAGGFDLFPRDVPEMASPTSLISGYENVSEEIVPDRVYAMCSLPVTDSELPVVMGLGNHQVRWYGFRLGWRLRKQAREIGQRLIAEATTLEELLEFLQQVALFSVYWKDHQSDPHDFETDPKRDKHTLLELIPRLGRECRSDSEWRKLFLLVWDVLARRTPRYMAVGMIQALRRIQLKLLDRSLAPEERLRRQAEIEAHISHIRRFVLDPGTYSKKQSRFLELASSSDPSLYDERVVYRSILISRRHDPVFLTELKSNATGFLGEVISFTPLPSATGRPFWDTAPERMRFVAANYQGELWLLDAAGDGYCLIPAPADNDKGYVRAAQVFGEELLLSFSRGSMLRLPLAQIPSTIAAARHGAPEARAAISSGGSASSESPEGSAVLSSWARLEPQPIDATAFSVMPAQGESEASHLLWGDSRGRIHVLGQKKPLAQLGKGASEINPESLAILRLEGFVASWSAGRQVPLVIAALASGRLCLLRWRQVADGPRLEPLAASAVCSSGITSLLVTGPDLRHVVVASIGTVIGLQILGPPSEPHLGPVWAFSTGDSVRSIQPLSPAETVGQGPARADRILVGSHDAHIYALDVEGRHLETYSFRQDPLRHDQASESGFKIGLFVTAPPRQPEDGPDVMVRVYACAFENRFCGLRLIDRPGMLKTFDDELVQLDARQREEQLTRWRAFHVEEGHLRHRFIRQSLRYPRAETAQVLEAIDWLLEAGNSSYEPTGEMTALLRRLFQDRRDTRAADAPQGLRAILADSRFYLEAVHLLQECGKRWDTPASIANRRVQLFWIRSFLREMDGKLMLRQWLALGETTGGEEPSSHPESILRHFLEHSHTLIQYKTLQYIERMLFGWPWVGKERMFEPGEARASDLDWLLRSLFSRLRLRPEQVQQIDPSPVVLQIGRLLCLLLRDRHVDPFYLTYLLQGYGLRQAMYLILADQWQAMAHDDGDAEPESPSESSSESPDLRPDEVIRLAGRLDRGLEEGAPLDELVGYLKQLMARRWPSSRGPDKEYLKQTPEYLQTLIPLLEVKSLHDLRDLASRWQPPPAGRQFSYCPTYARLAELQPLLEAVQNYYLQKYNDQWVDPVMTHLRFEDFDGVRREWRIWRADIERLLLDRAEDLAAREARLVQRLVEHWDAILLEAENVALLQDFQLTVEAHCFKEIEPVSRFSSEALEDLREEKLLALTAFTNLFTRLLLLAEPIEAAFLVRNEKEQAVLGYWFDAGSQQPGELRQISSTSELPEWIVPDWFELGAFQELGARSIHDRAKASHEDRVWRVSTIASSPGEPGYLGFYVFSWRDAQSAGFQRFESQRLAWSVPLQALVYRRAAVEQEELKGRLFSIVAHNLGSPIYLMRSDLKVLVDGRLENFEEHRHDKYRQLLRQARHMDAIVDSILSLSDREIDVELGDVAVARLVYEVVRTVRREAKPKNVQIDYPEPTEEQEQASMLVTDETKVYDILLNLLVNAVKYSPRSGRVRVSTEPSTKGIEVRIEDQGPGIPTDERPRIFEPFFRGAAAQRVAGLGLGLYSAKLYTDLLQGQIQIFKASGGGSIFVLFLPYLEENPA